MIRRAEQHESQVLTEISFAAKRIWNYPDEYFEIWEKELTITPNYIDDNDVFVFVEGVFIRGYYSLVALSQDLRVGETTIEKGLWLDHMFVLPDFIGIGIGTNLMDHLRKEAQKRNAPCVKILSDPNAKLFYQKMGCYYLGEVESTIYGRTTPKLQLEIAG